MKESAVVMGFKALASKLHPQLPLSSRESQRLLTALTSSFRKHLDEAHPSTAEEKTPRISRTNNLSTSSEHTTSPHSSAAYTDQHMSNVLTMFQSPRAIDHVAKAKEQLAAGADPLALLEEYEEKGVANVAIAVECLAKFKVLIDHMTYAEQAKITQEKRAGSRALGWLWHSDRHLAPEFIENKRFGLLLARLVTLEDSDELLWDWLQLDMKETVSEKVRDDIGPQSARMREFRWKTRLLRAMIRAPLTQPHKEAMSLDPALHIFFRAAEMRKASNEIGGHFQHVRVTPALEDFVTVLAAPGRQFVRTDPKLMQRLLRYVANRNSSPTCDFFLAALSVLHPLDPDPGYALEYLRAAYANDGIEQSRCSGETLKTASKSHQSRIGARREWNFMAATSSLLSARGHHQDAAWVREILLKEAGAERETVQTFLDTWNKHFAARSEKDLLPKKVRGKIPEQSMPITYTPAMV